MTLLNISSRRPLLHFPRYSIYQFYSPPRGPTSLGRVRILISTFSSFCYRSTVESLSGRITWMALTSLSERPILKVYIHSPSIRDIYVSMSNPGPFAAALPTLRDAMSTILMTLDQTTYPPQWRDDHFVRQRMSYSLIQRKTWISCSERDIELTRVLQWQSCHNMRKLSDLMISTTNWTYYLQYQSQVNNLTLVALGKRLSKGERKAVWDADITVPTVPPWL